MEKKSIILLSISIFVVIVAIYFLVQFFMEESESNLIYSKKFNFVVKDISSKNITDAHFYIYKQDYNTTNKVFLKQGDFSKGLNQVNLTYGEETELFKIITLKANTYSLVNIFTPLDDNIQIEISQFPLKESEIEVNQIELIKNTNQNVKLDITSEKEIMNPIHCFRWSLGIMNINGNQEVEVPDFLGKKVDKCFQAEENYFIDTGVLNADDYIDLYILDQCLIKDDDFTKEYYEYQSKDVCMGTYKYQIY